MSWHILDNAWNVLKFPGLSWYNPDIFLTYSWHFLAVPGISDIFLTYSWHFLAFHDMLWYAQTGLDISWHFLTFPEIFLHSLPFSDIFLTRPDISWHFLKYSCPSLTPPWPSLTLAARADLLSLSGPTEPGHHKWATHGTTQTHKVHKFPSFFSVSFPNIHKKLS